MVVKVTVAVFLTFATIADTVAVPAVAEVSVTVATPLVAVRIRVWLLPSVKVPRVVSNSTAVPLGTGALVASVTVAVMTELEFTCGVGFVAQSHARTNPDAELHVSAETMAAHSQGRYSEERGSMP